MQQGYDLYGGESKNINILLNIKGQGADFGKEFQREVSNCHDCQVLRGKMPLIPGGLKALLIFLRGHFNFGKSVSLETQIKCCL